MPASMFQTMLTGFGTLSAAALLCAGLAGLSVFLVLRDPAGQLRRLTRRRSRLAEAAAPFTRLIGGGGCTAAEAPRAAERDVRPRPGVAAAGIDGWLGRVIWFAVPVVAATGVLVLGWIEPRSARRRRQS